MSHTQNFTTETGSQEPIYFTSANGLTASVDLTAGDIVDIEVQVNKNSSWVVDTAGIAISTVLSSIKSNIYAIRLNIKTNVSNNIQFAVREST